MDWLFELARAKQEKYGDGQEAIDRTVEAMLALPLEGEKLKDVCHLACSHVWEQIRQSAFRKAKEALRSPSPPRKRDESEVRASYLAALEAFPPRFGSCQRCGHVWGILVAEPRRCPNCKRSDWNKPLKRPRKAAAGE